jgi:hypothetical protein
MMSAVAARSVPLNTAAPAMEMNWKMRLTRRRMLRMERIWRITGLVDSARRSDVGIGTRKLWIQDGNGILRRYSI